MLKNILRITIAMCFSVATNADTIMLIGSIVEETCSSSSDNKSCVRMYDVIKVKGQEGSTVAELSKSFNKQNNEFAIVEIDKIQGNNNAVIITANYF